MLDNATKNTRLITTRLFYSLRNKNSNASQSSACNTKVLVTSSLTAAILLTYLSILRTWKSIMKSIDQNNLEIIETIEKRKLKITELKDQAHEKSKNNQNQEAIALLKQAQHLAICISDGLKIKVMNEPSDNSTWTSINDEIQI